MIVLLVLLCYSFSFSTVFHFINEPGRKYRFKNLIKQDIYQNGIFYKSIEAMNKAMLEVTGVTNSFGLYQGKYYYYEKNLNFNESYKLINIYESSFYQNGQGQMIISSNVLMPSLRSIPVFPTNDIKPGDSWKAIGEEIHEGIFEKNNILRFNVEVSYKYLGEEVFGSQSYSKISIDYHIIHYPVKDPDVLSFTGFSHSIYYWDLSNCSPVFYNEDYSLMFTLHNGNTFLFTGTTEGKVDLVSDISNIQKEEIIGEINSRILPNSGVIVKEVPEGIVVNLGNILFDINKATIKNDYEKRLDSLVDVLRKYPQIDIVVSGNTDNTGLESYNQLLSESRAKTVSDYLIKKGIAPTRISYIGNGSSKPIADNSTDDGRIQNRRVEIKLITKE